MIEEEMFEAVEVPEDEPSEVEENDDGSATITLEDSEVSENQDFYANIVESLDRNTVRSLATELLEYVEQDKKAREKRDEQYEEGLRRTGLGDDAPGGAEFDGAARAVHPVMAESCIDFGARAIKELCPSNGPVRTHIIGKETPEKLEKAERKSEHMNWQLTQQSAEYRAELEQLLTQLPLGGSQYMKIWWDVNKKRPRFEFIPIDNVFIPFSASSLYTAERYTVMNDLTDFEFRKRIREGQYIDVDAIAPSMEPDPTKPERANRKIEGIKSTGENQDGVRRTYEVYTFADFEEDSFKNQSAPCPYIITIDEDTHEILSIYRNWDMEDPEYNGLEYLVEWNFIPWRGAYAVGLPHLIGGLSAALTGALRALLDSAHIQNSATVLKLKGSRISGQTTDIAVTQVTEIEGPPGTTDVRQLAMPLPFPGPSPTLFQLLGWIDQAARGVVATAEEKIAEAGNNMPVGTAMALIEQGSKVFSAIHARLHQSQHKVLNILHRLNKMYLEDETTLSDIGELIVHRKDYDGPLDVAPVSDPNIFSETQRSAQNQLLIQLSQMFPNLYDARAINKRILEQNKIPNIQEVLPEPPKPEPQDPVSENVLQTMNKPTSAFPWQDHEAHIQVHLHFATSPLLGANPIIQKQYLPQALEHLKQHLVFWYARAMGDIVESVTGMKIQDLGDTPQTEPLVSEAFAAALPHLNMMMERQPLAHALPPLIQQAIQVLQQGAPPPPMDPAQVAIQDVQARAQAKAQELQIKQQDSMLRAQMNAEDNTVKQAMNDADNATALQLKQMSIAEHATRTAHDPNPMPDHRTAMNSDPAGSHNPSPAGMV